MPAVRCDRARLMYGAPCSRPLLELTRPWRRARSQLILLLIENALESTTRRGAVKLAIHAMVGADTAKQWPRAGHHPAPVPRARAAAAAAVAPAAATCTVVIMVSDDGLGLESGVQHTIFDGFGKVRAARQATGAPGCLRSHARPHGSCATKSEFGARAARTQSNLSAPNPVREAAATDPSLPLMLADPSGLGLALVKGIAEAHGGSVGAHSDGVLRGSTIYAILPLPLAGAAAADTSPASVSDEQSTMPGGRSGVSEEPSTAPLSRAASLTAAANRGAAVAATDDAESVPDGGASPGARRQLQRRAGAPDPADAFRELRRGRSPGSHSKGAIAPHERGRDRGVAAPEGLPPHGTPARAPTSGDRGSEGTSARDRRSQRSDQESVAHRSAARSVRSARAPRSRSGTRRAERSPRSPTDSTHGSQPPAAQGAATSDAWLDGRADHYAKLRAEARALRLAPLAAGDKPPGSSTHRSMKASRPRGDAAASSPRQTAVERRSPADKYRPQHPHHFTDPALPVSRDGDEGRDRGASFEWHDDHDVDQALR